MTKEFFSKQETEKASEQFFAEFEKGFLSNTHDTMLEIGKRNMSQMYGRPLKEEDLQKIEEKIDKEVDKEKQFARCVIEAYSRWAKEQNPIVLWDVDETMGKYRMVSDNKNIKDVWGFRESLLPLLGFLKDKFPQIRNGILSSRTHLKEQLDNPMILGKLQPFIDTRYLYSSRNVELDRETEESYMNSDLDLTGTGTMQKAEFLKQLKGEGLNVKIIDDDKVAKLVESNGVWTWLMYPDEIFCE